MTKKLKQISYAKNIQSINLITSKERVGKPNFYPSVIKNCGNTLANRLIDYMKKGGDINNLTPDNVLLEDKVEYEQNHQIKPLEKEQIVNFLKVYARKQFDNKTDKNEFFNNFILKVLLYDDKITIVYNTSLNPAEEIYSRPNDNDDNNGNSDNGTTIYKKEIEISDADNKKLPFEFKRQLFGGKRGI